MQKNLAASFLALTLMFAPNAYAQDTTTTAPSGGSSIDVQVDAPQAPAAPSSTETNINVDAPSAPAATAPSTTTTESTTVRENTTNTHVATVDEPGDHNWGIIVGAGLIGLTVLALLLNSRRTV